MFRHIHLVALTVMCALCTVAQGNPANGSFEIPDPNRATEWFTPPLNWDWDNTPNNLNYANLVQNFTSPQGCWTIPAPTHPTHGNFFVLLSTGDAEGPRSDGKTEYSSIEQIITVCPGDTFYGDYFFGTCDYGSFCDTGIIQLFLVDPIEGEPNTITIVSESVATVGDRGYKGWEDFHYTFDIEECREYLLYCEVRDVGDRFYNSYLALDNFRICRADPNNADINNDCRVDLLDLSLLSKGWLVDCGISGNWDDPNLPCQLLTVDPNTLSEPVENIIDMEYLLPVTESWLEPLTYD